MSNPFIEISALKAKLKEGERITEDDLKSAFEACKASGSIDSRVVYSMVKQRINDQSDESEKLN